MTLVEALRDKFEIGRHRLSPVASQEQALDGHVVETPGFATAAGEVARAFDVQPWNHNPVSRSAR